MSPLFDTVNSFFPSIVRGGARAGVPVCRYVSGSFTFFTEMFHYRSVDAMISCIDRDCPTTDIANADQQILSKYKKFLRQYCDDASYQNSKLLFLKTPRYCHISIFTGVITASINCPVFRNVTTFPTTTASLACATSLLDRDGIAKNYCSFVEANVVCFGLTRGCGMSTALTLKIMAELS